MRFSLSLPTDRVDNLAEFGSADAVMEMARTAEQYGFDAVFVTDHPIPSDRWLAHGGHHTFDPFVALSFAAAATSRLRLQTNLCVAPYRNPFLTAKAVATLDSMSGGRVIFGTGVGYLKGEFRALGADFERRNELLDEALAVMKKVWSGESVTHAGMHFEAAGNTALPRPAACPHPPIWIGGNSKRAIRRAVEHGDGWMPIPSSPALARTVHSVPLETLDDLRRRLAYAREHAAAVGRKRPLDLFFSPLSVGRWGEPGFSVARLLDEIAVQAEIGVTQMSVGFERQGTATLRSRTDLLQRVRAFGEEVISVVADRGTDRSDETRGGKT